MFSAKLRCTFPEEQLKQFFRYFSEKNASIDRMFSAVLSKCFLRVWKNMSECLLRNFSTSRNQSGQIFGEKSPQTEGLIFRSQYTIDGE